MIIKRHDQNPNLDEAGTVPGCQCNWCTSKRREYTKEQAAKKLSETHHNMILDTSSDDAPEINTVEIKRYVDSTLSHYCATLAKNGRQSVEQVVVKAMNDHPALSRFVVKGSTDNPSAIYADLVDLAAKTEQRLNPRLTYTQALDRVKESNPELVRLYGSSMTETRPDPLAEQQQRQGQAGDDLWALAQKLKKENPGLSDHEALKKAGAQRPDLLAAYNNHRR